jgi:hypothetical protein
MEQISDTMFRDAGLVVNTDKTMFASYLTQRNLKLKEQQELASLSNRINTMESQMSDIQALLRNILAKLA